jgi:hypothetical protein
LKFDVDSVINSKIKIIQSTIFAAKSTLYSKKLEQYVFIKKYDEAKSTYTVRPKNVEQDVDLEQNDLTD